MEIVKESLTLRGLSFGKFQHLAEFFGIFYRLEWFPALESSSLYLSEAPSGVRLMIEGVFLGFSHSHTDHSEQFR